MATAQDKPCIKQDGVTDASVDIVGNLLAAASVLAAGYNTYRAVDLATKEWLMADKYYQITQNWMDYYQGFYAPVEDQEVNEALNLPIEEPDYETARGRARTVAWLQFKDVVRTATKCTSRYCTGLRQDMLADLSAAQANAVAMADALGYRNERAYIESRNEQRFVRMMETAKRGRDMVAGNPSLANAAAGIYGDLFDQAWAGLVGAGNYLGYYTTRNQTNYPATYLNTNAMTETKTAATGAHGQIVQGSQGSASSAFRTNWQNNWSSGMQLNTGGEG